MEIYTDHSGRIVSAVHTRSEAAPLGDHANLFVVKHGEGQTGLPFQTGPVEKFGVNGLSTECVLAALIRRTEVLNEHLQCPENVRAIVAMKEALSALELRDAKRRFARIEEADRA